ncbi:unnamed protein product [Protopolystoma xenopodis]|uniref:Uncharacterized protein n=1 Tax=Protopolystoma xenopodis TaxID=117903 RepID=A0A448WS53_9PLAT|nr:unnamed protein product [Protopolystoma xenopodis]
MLACVSVHGVVWIRVGLDDRCHDWVVGKPRKGTGPRVWNMSDLVTGAGQGLSHRDDACRNHNSFHPCSPRLEWAGRV